jgi:hypothetical protein
MPTDPLFFTLCISNFSESLRHPTLGHCHHPLLTLLCVIVHNSSSRLIMLKSVFPGLLSIGEGALRSGGASE